MRKTYVVVGILALGLLAGGAWWWTHQGASEAVQYRTAPLSRGTLQASVAASGAVNPVSLGVPGGARVRAWRSDPADVGRNV